MRWPCYPPELQVGQSARGMEQPGQWSNPALPRRRQRRMVDLSHACERPHASRALVAQAIVAGLHLVTTEPVVRSYPAPVVW